MGKKDPGQFFLLLNDFPINFFGHFFCRSKKEKPRFGPPLFPQVPTQCDILSQFCLAT